MATTYELIASTTVGSGGASSIDFDSIPGTYNDLLLLVSLKDNGSGDINNMNIGFNSSTSNFSYRSLYTFGSSAASDNSSNNQFIGFTTQSGSGVTSIFNNMQIYIPNYTSSNYKSISVDGASEKNGTTSVGLVLDTSLWSNTAAITKVTLTSLSQNWVQYSTAYLYGIKNS